MSILEEIVENKKIEVEKAKTHISMEEIQQGLTPSTRSLFNALKGKHNIISELKFNAPSCGELGRGRSIEEIIKVYDKYACAISVLTDEKYFSGKLEYIEEVKKYTRLPVLRKDFIIDKYQIYEARKFGADAILLIASILSKEEIDEMLSIAKSLGMDCLVETKTEEEIDTVLKTKAKIIGINNRDLKTFKVDLNTTNRLKQKIPSDKLIVSESGIFTKQDIFEVNTNAVLIGTSLMKAENMEKLFSSLHRCKVKVCGVAELEDAKFCVEAGVDLIGFNFYEKSPRHITPIKAREIISTLPNTIQTVGVFVNKSKEEINEIVKISNVDFIQLHGDETDEFVQTMSDNIIRAIRVKDSTLVSNLLVYAKLFDTFDPKLFGGSGKEFDKNLVLGQKGKVFIAGGLNPENVTSVLETIHPYCLDTCSGVELTPGKKDFEKVKAFVKNVGLKEGTEA